MTKSSWTYLLGVGFFNGYFLMTISIGSTLKEAGIFFLLLWMGGIVMALFMMGPAIWVSSFFYPLEHRLSPDREMAHRQEIAATILAVLGHVLMWTWVAWEKNEKIMRAAF